MKLSRALVSLAAILAVFSAERPVRAAEPARSDAVLSALQAELERSMTGLKLDGIDRPYYVAFAVEERESSGISACFGAVRSQSKNRLRTLRTDVRLGGYDVDSSELNVGRSPLLSGFGSLRYLVLDDEVMPLRRDIWLAADDAYKEAAERFAQKKGILANRADGDPVADFTKAAPVVSIGSKKLAPELGDEWVARARLLSSVFREFPRVLDSSVTVHADTVHRTFVSSEGTRVLSPGGSARILVFAVVQTPDGKMVRQTLAVHESEPSRLPSEEKLLAMVRKFAADMTAVADAPALEAYVGPVLLGGEAAPAFFADLFAPQLSGRRPPLSAQASPGGGAAESELVARIGRPVLPDSFSVVDDPTLEKWNGRSLMGSYAVDDEGVPAQVVTLVDKGILETLLMGRRPRKEIGKSNGHGRAGSFQAPQPHVGNLFVTTSRGRTEEELKRDLIEKAKAQGLPFGLLVRSIAETTGDFGDPFSSGVGFRHRVGAPILAYKVFPDGREELVRGLVFTNPTLKNLREVVAAGKEGHLVSGAISPGGPTSSIMAPSVLFEELELKAESGAKPKPVLLSNPYFDRPRPK
jgi:predicted Zn-dependent protease